MPQGTILVVAAIVVLLIAAPSLKAVREDRRLAVLRLGRYSGLVGPGLVFLLPIVDRAVTLGVGQTGIMLESGTASFEGLPISVDAAFRDPRPGTPVRIEAFEGSGRGSRARVGRAE